jgi:peroxiredoxin
MPYTLEIGAAAPDFSLPATDGKMYALKDFAQAKILVIFFTCNHCPYATGCHAATHQTADKFKKDGVVFVAINSNSKTTYTEDSFEHMVERMKIHKYPWVYLHDESQQTARHYGALKTPHFYVFDQNRRLVYTGRSIDTPKDPSKKTVDDLERALIEMISNKPISVPKTNPIGCNIKWEGKSPHWMPPEACDLV